MDARPTATTDIIVPMIVTTATTVITIGTRNGMGMVITAMAVATTGTKMSYQLSDPEANWLRDFYAQKKENSTEKVIQGLLPYQ